MSNDILVSFADLNTVHSVVNASRIPILAVICKNGKIMQFVLCEHYAIFNYAFCVLIMRSRAAYTTIVCFNYAIS